MTTVNLTTPDPPTCKDPSSGTLLILCCTLAALLHVLVFVVLPPWTPSAQLKTPTAPTISYQSVMPNTVQQPTPRQVVTIPPPRKQQRPTHADLLAEWDTATKNPMRGPAGLRHATRQPPRAHSESGHRGDPHKVSKNFVGEKRTATPLSSRKTQASKAAPRLFPSWRELQPGVTGSPDDIRNVPRGDFVRLNTVQWRHAAFFNRMKESVVAAWHPRRRVSKHNPNGLGMQGRHHETVVRVTIDRNGNLVRARLAHSSGFAYLDDEALTAFQLAQPFLHPPQALFGTRQRFSFQAVLTVHVRHGGFY